MLLLYRFVELVEKIRFYSSAIWGYYIGGSGDRETSTKFVSPSERDSALVSVIIDTNDH